MRIRKIGALKLTVIVGLGCIVGACSSTSSDAPQKNIEKDAKHTIIDSYTAAECNLIFRLQEKRLQAGKRGLNTADCRRFFDKNSIYKPYLAKPKAGTKQTTMGSFGNIAALGNTFGNELPSHIENGGKGAKEVFRKMIVRGYDRRDVVAISKTAEFRNVAALNERAHSL